MKIIDEKGMLFGKINIIDFAVVVFLLSFIPILYMGYKLTARETDAKIQRVSLGVNFSGVVPELTGIMKVGDVEKNPLGKVVGQLSEISDIKPSEITVLMDNKMVTAFSNSRKDVRGKLLITCKERSRDLYYEEQLVKIGKDITFSTDMYVVSGKIVSMKKGD